jgi:hypothetical protein
MPPNEERALIPLVFMYTQSTLPQHSPPWILLLCLAGSRWDPDLCYDLLNAYSWWH